MPDRLELVNPSRLVSYKVGTEVLPGGVRRRVLQVTHRPLASSGVPEQRLTLLLQDSELQQLALDLRAQLNVNRS